MSLDDEQLAGDELRAQINKRLTLNLLIQGAAAHTFLTAHHLVSDELEAIQPGLTQLYDRVVVAFHLNYFIGDIPLVYGLPSRFWRRTKRSDHPFHHHPLLATYGGKLTRAAKRHLVTRGWKKGIVGVPLIQYGQLIRLHFKLLQLERGHELALAAAAKRATAQIWGIDEDRLVAEITTDVAFGNLRTPRTSIGRLTRAAAVGYGGVVRRGERFQVVAKAICLPLVMHELTKGTAELVCLHGLNSLDAWTYEQVIDEADQLEYETWLLQAGPEMWRRLLAVIPAGYPLPEVLMRIARLNPLPLERLMMATAGDPDAARKMFAVMLEN